jgi:hypothetical protein
MIQESKDYVAGVLKSTDDFQNWHKPHPLQALISSISVHRAGTGGRSSGYLLWKKCHRGLWATLSFYSAGTEHL